MSMARHTARFYIRSRFHSTVQGPGGTAQAGRAARRGFRPGDLWTLHWPWELFRSSGPTVLLSVVNRITVLVWNYWEVFLKHHQDRSPRTSSTATSELRSAGVRSGFQAGPASAPALGAQTSGKSGVWVAPPRANCGRQGRGADFRRVRPRLRRCLGFAICQQRFALSQIRSGPYFFRILIQIHAPQIQDSLPLWF